MVINANQIGQGNKLNQNEQSENAAVAQELRKIGDLNELQKQIDSKAYESIKSDAKHLEALRNDKAYYAKLQKDPGTKVLSNLAQDLAKIGIDLTPKAVAKFTSGKISDELDNIISRSNLMEDKAEVKNHLTREAVKRAQNQDEGREEREKNEKRDMRQLVNSADVKEAAQSYSSAYAQYALAASPEARERLEDAQDRLRKKGFSEKDIMSLERAVKKSFRTEFVSEIQDSFIQHMFSPKNTFQFVVTSKKLNNAFQEAVNAEGLTGIKNDPQAIKQEMARVADRSHEEISDFVRDAVESRLMERHINDRDNRDEVKKLVQLGYKVGFNFDHFMKTWEQKKFDLGLFVLQVEGAQNAEMRGEISIGDVSAGGVGDRHGYEMTKDEERELLINQLRAEFMKKAVTGDPFAVFAFAPKIRKLKNGLIKLGLETEEFSRIEKEARALARYRTLEMLRAGFIERSTYYELSGPAYNLLNNRLKGLISNLERLDMKLSREELDILRDEANRQMHDHTILELKSALALLENNENPALEQKVPLMIKLIQGLRAESSFQHGIGEDIDQVIFRFENNHNDVRENA